MLFKRWTDAERIRTTNVRQCASSSDEYCVVSIDVDSLSTNIKLKDGKVSAVGCAILPSLQLKKPARSQRQVDEAAAVENGETSRVWEAVGNKKK
jgi:hypothetical protein